MTMTAAASWNVGTNLTIHAPQQEEINGSEAAAQLHCVKKED